MNTTRNFTAVINSARIITVRATSEDEAKAEIARELSKPGRTDILGQWMKAGQQIEAEVLVVNICDLVTDLNLWIVPFDEQDAAVAAWVKENNAEWYSAEREKFSTWVAVDQARKAGKSIVVVEDLS